MVPRATSPHGCARFALAQLSVALHRLLLPLRFVYGFLLLLYTQFCNFVARTLPGDSQQNTIVSKGAEDTQRGVAEVGLDHR